MKNKGLIIGIIAGVVVIAVVVVCIVMANNSKNSEGSNGQSSSQEAENNKIIEVMKKLDAKMTLEEMNKIVGSEAKLDKEGDGWKKYVWEFGEKNQITATEYTKS